MKISFQSYSNDNSLDSYGGLEVRYSANWGEWLRQQGHEVFSCHQSKVAQLSNADLCFDAPVSDAYRCPTNKHLHCYFSPDLSGQRFLDCYKEGKTVFCHPTTSSHKQGWVQEQTNPVGIKRLFAPIPYPDEWIPRMADWVEPFERVGIVCANKGSFTPGFGEHRPKSSIAHLRVLARLAKEIRFKAFFAGDAFVDVGEYGPEVEKLLVEIPHERLERLKWQDLNRVMAISKLSLHPGGITGCIFESIANKALPVTPKDNGFFPEESREAALLPNANIINEDQLFETLLRLWRDKDFYYEKYFVFQTGFTPHRNPELYWNRILEEING